MILTTELLRKRKFLPLFITQLLGALNDNILRNGIIIFISFTLATDAQQAGIWANIATAMFILPVLIFSAISGELADKYKKSSLLRFVKLSEIFIIFYAAYLLLGDDPSPIFLMSCIFLMGTHAAIFSPAKFAYLPEYLEDDELLPANGLIEGSTFAVIAIGSGISTLIENTQFGIIAIVSIMMTVAVAGWLSSLIIPSNRAQNPHLKLQLNVLTSTQEKIDACSNNPDIWLPILGISWFWVVGMVHTANLANYVQFVLHYNASVLALLHSVFTIGIAFGSILCNKALKGEVNARFVPISLFLIGIFGIHLVSSSTSSVPIDAPLGTIKDFLGTWHNYIILLDFCAISIFSGLFVVPLYALLQKNSPQDSCAQVIATSNIVSGLYMICASLLSLFVLFILQLPITQLFFFTALFNIGLSMYLLKILPFSSIKPIVARAFKWFFRIETQGLEHFNTASKRLIIIANHVSFLDPVLLALFLPGEYIFAVDTEIAKTPIVKFARKFATAYEVDPTNPMQIRRIVDAISQGKRCIIFPEGRLTNTGSLMKIFEGTAAIANMSDADILPVHLSGLKYSLFSRLRGIFKLKLRTQVSITAFPTFKLIKDEALSSKEQRKKQVDQIHQALAYGQYVGEGRSPLYQSLIEAAKNHGYGHKIVEDFTRKKLSYRNLILKSLIIGRIIHQKAEKESNIGMLLPNTLANVVALFGLYAYRKVPTMLNYTAGSKNLVNSCITSQLKTVITSRQFISKADLAEELQALKGEVSQIIFLEDLAKNIGIGDKVKGLWRYLTINRFYRRNPQFVPAIDSPAAILFTSGSEGSPKGVVLSHRNITANIQQCCAVMDLNPTDTMFNALPMFHAFGFNLGTITPLLIGVKTFLYPNPKHFATVVELIYDTRATLLIGTNTFLSAYLKFSKSYDFNNLRMVFTGGEKLQDDTRTNWLEQRGIRLLEGYGSTECGPVISCNSLMYQKAHSVGMTLPGIETRYNPFPGLEIGGELCIRGENVMLGYLYLDNPGKIVPLPNGWYDTGDIVTYDDNGFITIVDRIKRFAKISGEMVSLSAIENEVAICWPEHIHGIVSMHDQKRGEKLILITDKPDADRAELARKLKSQGVSSIAVPSQIQVMKQIPLLGTGKVDYPKLIAFIKGIPSTTKNLLKKKKKDD
ncbi:MFS transporter [Candidatus Synchoanobacter obligatus]|uniref:MFS transporter n=1 Tax=Candidatus Synchoanobacter obligatus TaxID=2919597 RepID=A0ABT1L6G8_9GAMM|nr:MFS transporter [Candidatus Synchoanobacter obligatus]MCP8352521.1 MFS transporter [Candidatus Synchoanobacter obligatus]